MGREADADADSEEGPLRGLDLVQELLWDGIQGVAQPVDVSVRASARSTGRSSSGGVMRLLGCWWLVGRARGGTHRLRPRARADGLGRIRSAERARAVALLPRV